MENEFEMVKPKPLPLWKPEDIYTFIETVAKSGMQCGMFKMKIDSKDVTCVIHVEKERP